MKTTITLLIITLFCSLQLAAQNHKDYYPNGNLKEIGELDKSKHIGDWKYYHENGQLSGEGKYDLNGKIILGTWTTYNEKGVKDGCDCPPPTKEQFAGACHTIYEKQMMANPKPGVSYGYQDSIWEMSCAIPGVDNIETAKPKIQKMWNKYRENFRCYGYPNYNSGDKNIAKFSLDTGFTTFLNEAVKRYNLDMNFIDPGDGKTVLDFIKEREEFVRNLPPVDYVRAEEYNRFYNLLRLNGAKHRWELN